MLTSSHYLLGGFLAGSCAVGALLQTSVPANSNLAPGIIGSPVSETVEVSYRGSGRVEDDTTPSDRGNSSAQTGLYIEESTETSSASMEISDSELADSDGASHNRASGGKDLVSHRGSGRVRPSLL